MQNITKIKSDIVAEGKINLQTFPQTFAKSANVLILDLLTNS